MPCGPNDPHALPIHTSSAFFPRGIVNRSLITLGANLGDPLSQMREGLEQLSRVSDIHRISSLYRTQPAGGPLAQPPFLNAVVSIETDQSPEALLRSLQKIETEVGRVRQIRWGPRVLDLDLALFGDDTRSAEMTTTTDSQEADSQETLSQQGLALPHPRMAWRRFVLEPAAEVEPEWVHPLLRCSLRQLRDRLDTTTRYAVIGHGGKAGHDEAGHDEAGHDEASDDEASDDEASHDPASRVVAAVADRCKHAEVVADPPDFSGVRMAVVLEDKLTLTCELWAQGIPAIAIGSHDVAAATAELVGAIAAAQLAQSVEPWPT